MAVYNDYLISGLKVKISSRDKQLRIWSIINNEIIFKKSF